MSKHDYISFGRSAIIILFLSVITTSVMSGVRHPDGLTGQMNGWAAFDYAKAVPEANVLIEDRSHFECGLNLPVFELMTITGQIKMTFGDTLYYMPSIGLKLYYSDPCVYHNVNPDGAIGRPVFRLDAGLKISEYKRACNVFFTQFEVLMPLISSLSLGLGGYYFDDDDPFRVLRYYGQINFFPWRYDALRQYENPDGAEGWPSFYLTAGGSANGIFGRLDVAVPLSPKMTLIIYTSGERTPSPYVRIATLGVKFHFYPRQ